MSQDAGREIAQSAADHFIGVANALLDDRPLPFRIRVAGRDYLVTASSAVTIGTPRYLLLDPNGHPPTGSVYGPDLKLRKCSSPRYGTGRADSEVRRLRNEYAIASNEANRLREANSAPYSTTRRRLISEALLSFCIYTYFDTGANIATLQGQLRNGAQTNAVLVSDIVAPDGTLLLSAERGMKSYVLTTEKPRAGNKLVPIVFSSIWVKRILPVYLGLRKHLIRQGVRVPETLIFSLLDPARNAYMVEPNPRVSARLDSNRGHILNRILSKHGLKRISIREVRNYKSVAISRSHGPAASANLLGHSLSTALKHYNRIEETESQLQLSGSLNKILSIAVVGETEAPSKRLPAGGACTREDSQPPVEIASTDLGLHSPSCKTRTGCWMCPHFAVHADEEELWKMKSYLFVIEELRSNSLDQAGAAAVHKPIVDRLNALCERVVDYDNTLREAVENIDALVADGQVHPLYKSLIRTYEMVGLI